MFLVFKHVLVRPMVSCLHEDPQWVFESVGLDLR